MSKAALIDALRRFELDEASDHHERQGGIEPPEIVRIAGDHGLSRPSRADDDVRIDDVMRAVVVLVGTPVVPLVQRARPLEPADQTGPAES